MNFRPQTFTLVTFVSVVVAFWAGFKVQEVRFEDICLDLGGGRNPGNLPICTVEHPLPPLTLGPVLVTDQDLLSIKANHSAGDHTMVHLVLKPEIAAALEGFTKAAVGQELPIRISGQLVNSVIIQEATIGTELTIALPGEKANQLISLLSSESL